ncbi:flavin reductase family protein [Rhizorhabdus dicambivorans]|uniref:Flavin reductase family protein n=1 Tax=Rhizorhabdus dicambivorans TaxID=1850238 RepID=A0A2A4FWN2_9SPHN|nr:flavin reductase family protein [Rhizorhabdus dicambivorans]ATE65505.1 flavin reductase family protein [Rhizorhabdus dicambivorans]PCE41848.1 flavin reductase family protein [Rhizorhabdus dicambivorans]
MEIDLSAMAPKARYNLLTGLVVPRPIAWVTSRNEDGRLNAAPFSFFNLMSGTPPILCLGIGERGGAPKDTARNIAATGEFVVNLVNEDCAVAMTGTAIDFPEDVDELAVFGLETLPSRSIEVPRIAMSPVAFECRLIQTIAIGHARSILIAELLVVHIADDVVLDVDRGHLDTGRLGLIGRMQGGGWYSRTSDGFRVPQVTLAEWERGVSPIRI